MKPTKYLLRAAFAGPLVIALAACGFSPGEISPGDLTTQVETGINLQGKYVPPSDLPLVGTLGTYMSAPRGPLFEPMDTLDPRNAMIYVYRPSSSWEDQEIQAPSFYLDGRRVIGLKSGSYSWLEVHGGRFKLYAKRPLGILHLKKIMEVDMEIEGGRSYYLRYSEESDFDYKAAGLNQDEFMHDGPLQEVPEYVALGEISSLRLDQQGVYFAGRTVAQQPWKPFDSFPRTGEEAPVEADAGETAADAAADDQSIWQSTKNWFGNLF